MYTGSVVRTVPRNTGDRAALRDRSQHCGSIGAPQGPRAAGGDGVCPRTEAGICRTPGRCSWVKEGFCALLVQLILSSSKGAFYCSSVCSLPDFKAGALLLGTEEEITES